jgi:3-isopropylmalate/(R)-2-methylmalate dehydratase large subunit
VGRSIVEKIFSRNCGRDVRAGDMVVANIDLVMATDGSGPLAIELFRQMEVKRVWDPKRVLMVLDHYVPCPNDKVARLHEIMRAFCRAGNGVLFDMGEGIGHQLLPEKGYIRPGTIVAGADSHSTVYGALNAIGTGIGSSDLAAAMATGQLWFQVPKSVKVTLQGKLPHGTTSKDAALWMVGSIGDGGANYRALEFQGEGIHRLDMDDRLTLCNLAVETGAKCAVMPFDRVAAQWLLRSAPNDHKGVAADPNAEYESEVVIDLSTIEPQIAAPHKVDNIRPISQIAGTPVHMALIGTCTNGRLKDLQLSAEILSRYGKAPGVELLIVPASKLIYIDAARSGLLEVFASVGALILPPGCGPCCGSSAGIPGDGQNVFSTANRNFLGRMGNVKANIYLGSPLSVAASAVTGEITDPRRFC